MKNFTRSWFLILSCLLVLSGCSDYPLSPIIDSVHADKDEVEVNETVTIYCEAFGVYGDDLTFVWSAEKGSFPNGNTEHTIDWKAPDQPGISKITVEATNGSNFKSKSIDITVTDSGNETEFDGVIDYDGKQYKYKVIGTQTWMIENLAYIPAVSPYSISSNEQPQYYVYDFDGTDLNAAKSTDNYTKLGVLYNWFAALQSCPNGWHLPSDEEWKVLEMYLGMSSSIADGLGERLEGDVGRKLKSKTGWVNGGGDNSSGFSALPGGFCTMYGFEQIDSLAHFWTSYASGDQYAYRRDLYYSGGGIHRYDEWKSYGFSVRCIKD